MTKERQFGLFGSGVKKQPRRRFVKIFFLFIAALVLPAALFGWVDFYQDIVEGESPVIQVIDPPVGFGIDPAELKFTVKDTRSGLDEVIVRLEQSGRRVELFRKTYPSFPSDKQSEDNILVRVNGKDYGLKEGEAKVVILAFDRSYRKNAAEPSSFVVQIDYKRPQIHVLDEQHNAVLGGAELVFYNVRDQGEVFGGISGMKVGSELLPGFPAERFDEAFKSQRNLFCAFFPVPWNFRRGEENIQVFARDVVGNMSFARVSYNIQPLSFKKSNTQLDPQKLDPKLEKLYRDFLDKEAKLNGQTADRIEAINSPEERVRRFQTVNEKYRELIDRAMKPLFGRPKSERFWQGRFLRPEGREIVAFGEEQSFTLDGQVVSQYRSRGQVIQAKEGAEVRAANRGVVIYSDDLGPYGRSLIVDHGFGLTTLYSNLSETTRFEGDRVERSEVIGKLGTSGLVFIPAVGFEVRLHGVPVRPIEWLDENWLNDHVDDKVRNTKKALGMPIIRELN